MSFEQGYGSTIWVMFVALFPPVDPPREFWNSVVEIPVSLCCNHVTGSILRLRSEGTVLVCKAVEEQHRWFFEGRPGLRRRTLHHIPGQDNDDSIYLPGSHRCIGVGCHYRNTTYRVVVHGLSRDHVPIHIVYRENWSLIKTKKNDGERELG